MIKIHATKKLTAKLPLDESGMLQSTKDKANGRLTSGSPLGSWHANLLILQSNNCILFMHDATRFPVFLKELSKPDFAELDWHFEDAFMNTLLKAGANDAQMQAASDSLRPLQFDNDCDRSVQGAMNQRAQDIEDMLWRENIPLSDVGAYRTGAWLSEMLTKIKGMKDYIRPNKEMFRLLDRLNVSGANSAPDEDDTASSVADSGKVVSLDSYRK
jgi:hypothetical protein